MICSSSTKTCFADSINLAPKDVAALRDLLQACDGALRACERASDAKQAVNDQSGKVLEEQSREIIRLREEQDSLKRNPTLWFVVGLLTAGLTVALVK